MRQNHRSSALMLAGLGAAAAAATGTARADVTIQEQTTFDFTLIKAHGTSTEYTTSDKQRRDSDLHCEGFMSLFCRDAQSGEIIRLDRDLTWTLEPKKKEYRESPFMTAAQRLAAEQQAQALMEKMKQCPAVQNPTPAPDTSKCQMSPPKFDVKQPGTHAMIAGHDTQLTQMALTQSCTNTQTGDTCDFVFALDAWLTQDELPGIDDHKAFGVAYAKKLGLDDQNSLMQKQMRQFLAPYSASLKELGSKAGGFKGYPLKTAVRIGFGGEHCSSANKSKTADTGSGSGNGSVVGDAAAAGGNAATNSASGAAGSAAGNAAANAAGNPYGGSILSSAANAFSSKLVSGLFQKKKSDSNAGGSSSTSSGTPGSGLPPGIVQAAAFTVETTAIIPGTVADTQFDIPAGWKLITPQPGKEKEFSCPNAKPGS
jgi:hypothetical protein